MENRFFPQYMGMDTPSFLLTVWIQSKRSSICCVLHPSPFIQMSKKRSLPMSRSSLVNRYDPNRASWVIQIIFLVDWLDMMLCMVVERHASSARASGFWGRNTFISSPSKSLYTRFTWYFHQDHYPFLKQRLTIVFTNTRSVVEGESVYDSLPADCPIVYVVTVGFGHYPSSDHVFYTCRSSKRSKGVPVILRCFASVYKLLTREYHAFYAPC